MDLEGARLDIYELGHELGRGGMGTVYRAQTRADRPLLPVGSVVAVKVFHPRLMADERTFARFRQEAEIGKEIHHENLVRTYGIGTGEWEGAEHHFLVMELIEGETLGTLQERLHTLPEHLIYLVADQALGAMQAIHERGVVHRDIKPDNIVITPDHRVLLMDFGVARRQSARDLSRDGEFSGSIVYAAPEQCRGMESGPRADIYALGMTLCELATGRHPYAGVSVTEILRMKLVDPEPPPWRSDLEVDPFLDEVIDTCLAREQADRFASAAELRRILAHGRESVWWSGRTQGGRFRSSQPGLRRIRPSSLPPRVGRARELKALREVAARAREGGATLLLSGLAGSGKSRLLYDYLEEVVGSGGPAVAVGRGGARSEGGYGPFLTAVRDLLAPEEGDWATIHHILVDAIRKRLPDTGDGIVFAVADLLQGTPPDDEDGLSRDALFGVIGDLLRSVADSRPLLLVIDDLHEAGPETLELFEYVARCVPGHPILLVGVYSTDEVVEGSPIERLVTRPDGPERLSISNLGSGETEELVRLVVGHERTVQAIAPRLVARSEGSPFIVLETLTHLERKGHLIEEGGGLELTSDLGEVGVADSLQEVVAMKLDPLDEDERNTLQAAAVIGREFDAALLAGVRGEPLLALLQRLAGLERTHRLLTSFGKDSFRFAGRQLRRIVYDDVPAESRREIHSKVADALSSAESPSGETAWLLLWHLLKAGRAEEAEPFLPAALNRMAATLHASDRAPLLENIAEAFARAPDELRFTIAMRQWSCYEFLASREDQLRVLEQAADLAERMGAPGPRARVHAYRAGTHWYAGEYDRAEEAARQGLSLARDAGDRRWESTCLHTIGVVAWRRGEIEESARRWREALDIRREIDDRKGVASTLQALALVMPKIGEDDEAVLAVMREAISTWREIGERRGEASMLMNLGNRLVDMGRDEEGRDYLTQAVERHRETGALSNEAMALTNLGRALDLAGRVDEARVSLERALQIFVDLGNSHGQMVAKVTLGGVLASYGEHDLAREHLEAGKDLAKEAGNRIWLRESHRQLGLLLLLHRAGSREEGWAHLETALGIAKETQDREALATVRTMAGRAALEDGDTERAIRYLEDALVDAGQGNASCLILSRLARSLESHGDGEGARRRAREVARSLGNDPESSPARGIEIYFTLHELIPEEGDFLRSALALVETQAQSIRNDTYREYFLTRTWPAAEILRAGLGHDSAESS